MLGSLFQKVNTTSLFYPCEFTPEYVGVPPVFPNEQPNKTIGGGFVDTYVSHWHQHRDIDVTYLCCFKLQHPTPLSLLPAAHA